MIEPLRVHGSLGVNSKENAFFSEERQLSPKDISSEATSFSSWKFTRAIVVVAPENFQDFEFFGTIEELKKAGIHVEVISTKKGKCIGVSGLVVEAKTISDIKTDEFDSIVFIGGSGTYTVRSDKKMVALAEEFFLNKKIIGAICLAPTILAKAGILKGKKSTVWVGYDSEYSKNTDCVLMEAGAIFVNKPVVEDETIITANGPQAARAFGKRLAEKIKNRNY